MVSVFRFVLAVGLLALLGGTYYLVMASRVGSSEGAGQLAYVATGIGGVVMGLVALLVGAVGAAWAGRRKGSPHGADDEGHATMAPERRWR